MIHANMTHLLHNASPLLRSTSALSTTTPGNRNCQNELANGLTKTMLSSWEVESRCCPPSTVRQMVMLFCRCVFHLSRLGLTPPNAASRPSNPPCHDERSNLPARMSRLVLPVVTSPESALAAVHCLGAPPVAHGLDLQWSSQTSQQTTLLLSAEHVQRIASRPLVGTKVLP